MPFSWVGVLWGGFGGGGVVGGTTGNLWGWRQTDGQIGPVSAAQEATGSSHAYAQGYV